MAAVFISVVTDEQYVAHAIRKLLTLQLRGNLTHRDVFFSDEWQIDPGQNWLDRIRAEMTTALVVLAVLGPASVNARWVHFESGAAWFAGKRIIPLCHGGLRKEALPQPWSALQAMELPHDSYTMVRGVARAFNDAGRRHYTVEPRPPIGVEHDHSRFAAELEAGAVRA